MVAILAVAADRKLMCNQPSSIPSRVIVAICTLLMFGAAVGMFHYLTALSSTQSHGNPR